MDFKRIESALGACTKHLDEVGGDPQIESYLVGYLLAIVYAEYEIKIVKAMVARIGRIASQDADVHRFIHARIKNRKGKIAIGDLTGILENFGTSCKNQFQTEITNQPAHRAWDSILNNRTAVAHSSGSMAMTLGDLKKAFHESQSVLRAFARAMGLKTAEIGNL